MMSLRGRLLLGLVSLLALGLTMSSAATFAAVRAYQFDRAEDELAEIGRDLQAALGGAASAEAALRRATTATGSRWLWASTARSAGGPVVIQLRTTDGRPRYTGPALATPPALPAALVPGSITADNPDGQRFQEVEDESAGGSVHRGRSLLVRTSWLPDQAGILVIAMRMAGPDLLLRRLLLVESVVTLVALGLVTLLGRRVVDRGMRPLDEVATTAAAIGAGDLTRRVARDDRRTEVGRLGAALNAMLAQLEEAFAQRAASEERLRRFVADASHELRTPVATIRGYAELFRRAPGLHPDDLATAMRRIESEAGRVGVLVDEMLLLARLDEGRSLDRDPVDLGELVTDAAAAARVVEPRRRIDLVRADPVVVLGDAVRLRQVVDNLLANAARHTPGDASVAVGVEAGDGWTVVEVADQGPGLTEEQRARVFQRFYRGDRARTRGNDTGAGLGLAIVAAITAEHGGTVDVRSRPGEGATFRVRLPLPPADTPGR